MTSPSDRVAYWRAWLSWALAAQLVLRYAVPLLACVAAVQWHEGRENASAWIAFAAVAWLAHVDLTRSGVAERARKIYVAWLSGCDDDNYSTTAEIEEMESHMVHLPWLERRDDRSEQ